MAMLPNDSNARAKDDDGSPATPRIQVARARVGRLSMWFRSKSSTGQGGGETPRRRGIVRSNSSVEMSSAGIPDSESRIKRSLFDKLTRSNRSTGALEIIPCDPMGWGQHDSLCRPGECVCGLDDLGSGRHEIQSSIEAVAEDALTKWRVRDIAGLEQLCAARFASLANELERDTDLYAP